ncbi:MAG: hypothetical protein LLF76_09545 [Planctomycetaceae bacterium]|nr:hypothetical protein [Planctomycetaceae bacterium]
MSVYDYIVIGFYLVFMLAMGPVFKSFSKTASDYFRCGGGMLWWVVGSSSFMTMFSAWSFTGGAAKAYETGTFFFLLFLCNFVGLCFTYVFTAARFRQMRIITAIEAVHKRYGNANEQVFTWLPIPFNIVFGGIWLYAIAVFMYSVFGIDMVLLIIGLGLTVMIMTLLGGAWAATAGDFIQMMIVLAITILMTVLTLQHPNVGGLTGLMQKLPEHHFNWTLFERPWVIVFFATTLMINQTVQNNSMLLGASKYVFVKNGNDAKKATLISLAGFLLLPATWMVPAVASVLVHPNLAQEYPNLNNPHEAAYVAMAITLLPKGLLGLLICAIFAASLTTMNSLLNVVAGTFVRNFYIRIVEKDASESRQILIGRIFIFIYVVCWIGTAILFVNYKELKLFDLLLICAASIQIPMTVPLFFGIFIKKTPPWAGWSTMAIGFAFSVLLRFVLTPEFLSWIFRPEQPFSQQELGDLNIAMTTGVLFAVCILWYFGTMFFYRQRPVEYVKQVDHFFEEMQTPIDMETEHGPTYVNDSRQYNVLGWLCSIYGLFILLLILIPNSLQARLGILFCGVTIGGTGLLLKLIARRLRKKGQLADNQTRAVLQTL